MDYGHKYADKKLVGVEYKMDKEYKKAYKDISKKARGYFDQFEDEDIDMREAYEKGEISKREYTRWRKKKMLTGAKYAALLTTLTKIMTNTNKRNMKILDITLKDVFKENLNYGAYEVCKGINLNISFGIYNKQAVERLLRDNPKMLPDPKVDIPKDLRWNRKKMNSALAQGIMHGDSIDKIAYRLQSVTNMNRTSAIRNARTMMTGAQNAGRLIRYKEARDKYGINTKKKWEATLDHVTRDSHVDVDGEVQELDKPFSNGLDYPGASGPPEEVYNCRCTMVSVNEGIKVDDSARFKALGNETYEEWKSKAWRHNKDGKDNVRNKKRQNG